MLAQTLLNVRIVITIMCAHTGLVMCVCVCGGGGGGYLIINTFVNTSSKKGKGHSHTPLEKNCFEVLHAEWEDLSMQQSLAKTSLATLTTMRYRGNVRDVIACCQEFN